MTIRKGRPLTKDAGKSFQKLKPWIAEGMGRRTWYKRRAAVMACQNCQASIASGGGLCPDHHAEFIEHTRPELLWKVWHVPSNPSKEKTDDKAK